jgi:PAS domain S-box-containing protein
LDAIVLPQLAVEVRKLIERARRQRAPVAKRHIALATDGGRRVVHLRVAPRPQGAASQRSYDVLIAEVPGRAPRAERRAERTGGASEAAQVARLKRQLTNAKEHFGFLLAEQEQKYREDLRELRATAQERSKASEELQVTIAELEAANAELEATNDELKSALTARAQAQTQLGASEQRIRALLETAAQGILTVGPNGRIALVNGAAQRMFGYTREELVGLPIEELVPRRFRAAHRRHRREYFRQPRSRPMGEGLSLLGLRKDGTTFPVEISLSYTETGEGSAAVAFVSDITMRRHGEARTRLLSEITQNMAEGVSMVEPKRATFVYANRTFERLFGYLPGELLGRPVTILNAGRSKEKKATARSIIASLHRTSTWKGAVHNVRKDGTLLWCDYSLFTLEHPEYGTVWVGICSDVTERKAAEHALRRSQQELRSLTARLISVQEEQYRHLSRELHDALGQKLAALGMELNMIEGQSPAGLASSQQRVRRIREQIAELGDEIQGISRRLHPTILDDLGLVAALKNECVAFSRQHGIDVGFDVASAPPQIPEDVKLCLYRIAQESLTNIAKHARARQVLVSLRGSSRDVTLRIEDVGDGFDIEEVRGKGGLGLVSMDERVRLVKGNLVIESQPGKGTTVEVRVPLRPKRRKERTR